MGGRGGRFWDKGVAASYSRRLVTLRVYALMAQRQDMGVFKEEETARALVDVMAAMCLHEYSGVRKTAQQLLPVVLRRFPPARVPHSRLFLIICRPFHDPPLLRCLAGGGGEGADGGWAGIRWRTRGCTGRCWSG